jgi:hypothetical protein
MSGAIDPIMPRIGALFRSKRSSLREADVAETVRIARGQPGEALPAGAAR